MRPFRDKKLLIATHNAGKLAEFARLFEPYGVEVVSAGELGLPEPAETEDSFLGNARIKAHAAAAASGLASLADDSGIEIDVLDGQPGVHTADWAETPDGRDFEMAMRRTWDAIGETGADEPYNARFRCTLVLAWPDGHEENFEGRIEGQITWPMRGEQGHGYDPIFQPVGQDIALGEMDPDEKNRIIHRADAFRKLVSGCFGR